MPTAPLSAVNVAGKHAHLWLSLPLKTILLDLLEELEAARSALNLMRLTCETYQFQALFYKNRLRIVEDNVMERFKTDPDIVRALMPFCEVQ